jgi:hypothetical protein
MMKSIYKILLLNVGVAIVIVIAYFITAFLLGYGSNSSYAKATMRLYVIFATIHFLINIWFLRKADTLSINSVAITFIELFLIYGLIAWYYNN